MRFHRPNQTTACVGFRELVSVTVVTCVCGVVEAVSELEAQGEAERDTQ
jgi:hypothetical protein